MTPPPPERNKSIRAGLRRESTGELIGVGCDALVLPLLLKSPTPNKTMKLQMTWPEIFERPELVATREPASLCADGLCAWANCMVGSEIPESFGDVLVAVGARLGMSKAATAENLSEHAKAKGWLPRENDLAQTRRAGD
jgi:hypothetical protein